MTPTIRHETAADHEAVRHVNRLAFGRDDEAGIVEALELGADDYLTKPFGMKELVARIRTALRHRLQTQGERAQFQSGDLSVDLVRRRG